MENVTVESKGVVNEKDVQGNLHIRFDQHLNVYVLHNDKLNSDTLLAPVTSSIVKGINAFKEIAGDSITVDAIVNESLKAGLSTKVRYTATVVEKNSINKCKVLKSTGTCDASTVDGYLTTQFALSKSLTDLAQQITAGSL